MMATARLSLMCVGITLSIWLTQLVDQWIATKNY
jgi:hypothetical protein